MQKGLQAKHIIIESCLGDDLKPWLNRMIALGFSTNSSNSPTFVTCCEI
jgi:hypothetical protein